MAKQIWLLNLPILTLFLISNGNLAYGKYSRLGLFDILSKVPQYFEEPIPEAEPEIIYQCADISNQKAYDIIEQIMNLALDALAEMTVEACGTTTPVEVTPEPDYPMFNPYYPMWPMMPGIPNQYGQAWPRQAKASQKLGRNPAVRRQNRRSLGKSWSDGMKRQSLYGR